MIGTGRRWKKATVRRFTDRKDQVDLNGWLENKLRGFRPDASKKDIVTVKKRTEECKTNRIKVNNILIERGQEMKRYYFLGGRGGKK